MSVVNLGNGAPKKKTAKKIATKKAPAMKSKGMRAGGAAMKSKGGAMGGKKEMMPGGMQYGGEAGKKKSKGMRMGGAMKSKGMKNGGKKMPGKFKKGGAAAKLSLIHI